jgi:hypothetical protein
MYWQNLHAKKLFIPGIRGEGDMARFHVTGGLSDPRKN